MTETGNQFLLLALYKTSVGSKLSNKKLAIETHSDSYANSITQPDRPMPIRLSGCRLSQEHPQRFHRDSRAKKGGHEGI